MNHSKKIWKLRKELKYLSSTNSILKKENIIFQRNNKIYRDKIFNLKNKNKYFYNNLKNLIKEQKNYYKLIDKYQQLEYDYLELTNYISKNKNKPENFKSLKECKICCNYILGNSFIQCPNINCSTYMHSKCLLKTKFKGDKCIYCFQKLK